MTRAESYFNEHFNSIRGKYGLSNGDKAHYKLAILMDMALNGTSPDRAYNTTVSFGNFHIPSHLYAQSIKDVRRWARAYTSYFIEVIKQSEALRGLLVNRFGCDLEVAPYAADFIAPEQIVGGMRPVVIAMRESRFQTSTGSAYRELSTRPGDVFTGSAGAPPPMGGNGAGGRRGSNTFA